MPLYEYECRQCGQQFEELVRPGTTPSCALCGSEDLERLFSTFAASSDTMRKANLTAVRRQGEKKRQEKVAADHRYMHDHMKDHH